ncbi:unnamed protein product [Thelazia callipaeda]|uniref:Uncharacterized protein n=1 Tax=Thelazia callipaeda TaxID=103827 RepID=A0A0N5D288_THECL|nr:unnamed protein product [Thelazia callipaeda]
MNFGKRSVSNHWNDLTTKNRWTEEVPQKKNNFDREFMNFGKRMQPFERTFMNFGKKRADQDAFNRDFLSFGKRVSG